MVPGIALNGDFNPSVGGGSVRMLLRYVVFERLARYPRRLGSGYPQHVTKLAVEGLAIGPFGVAADNSSGGVTGGSESCRLPLVSMGSEARFLLETVEYLAESKGALK